MRKHVAVDGFQRLRGQHDSTPHAPKLGAAAKMNGRGNVSGVGKKQRKHESWVVKPPWTTPSLAGDSAGPRTRESRGHGRRGGGETTGQMEWLSVVAQGRAAGVLFVVACRPEC